MKDKSKEFSCHTHSIYLAYPLRQKQNLPLGHKKKKQTVHQPLPDLLSAFFPPCSFLFPLALFFKVTWAQWQRGGAFRQPRDFKLSRPAGILRMSVLKSTSCTDTQCVFSVKTSSHSLPQFEEGEICFWNAAWNCSLHVTSCLVTQSSVLNIVYAVNTRLRLTNCHSNICPDSPRNVVSTCCQLIILHNFLVHSAVEKSGLALNYLR